MKTQLSVVLLFLAGVTACRTAPPADASSVPMQTAHTFTYRANQEQELRYLLYLPADYQGDTQRRWPLLVFLHGAGERGSDLAKVAVHGPPKVAPGMTNFPFILVSPQCPDDRVWSGDAVHALVQEISQKYSVDPSRRYLTGLSMGGYGTWDIGIRHPATFAAIAPICGGGEIISLLLASKENREALRDLGIWAFHGAKDSVVPLAESERMVQCAKRAGVREAKLTVYPEADHDSWTETYKNPELYAWFLRHQRPVAK